MVIIPPKRPYRKTGDIWKIMFLGRIKLVD